MADIASPIATKGDFPAISPDVLVAAYADQIPARNGKRVITDAEAAQIAAHEAALAGKAPLASPPLTGTPTAPTAAPGTNSQQIANAAFVKAAIDALVNGAPGALDALNELAAAIGNDPNFAATMSAALGNRLRIDTPGQGLTSEQKGNARTNIDAVALGAAITALVETADAKIMTGTERSLLGLLAAFSSVPLPDKLLRWADSAGRMVFEVDSDATKGARLYIPLALPSGSIPFGTLAADARIPFSLSDDASGYFFRLSDQAGRVVLGIPTDGSKPIQARVARAVYADSAALAEGVAAGSVAYASLSADLQARLPFALTDDASGYYFRLLDQAGRLLLGIPNDGSRPIEARVARAVYAETAAIDLDSNATYIVESYLDSGRVRQLRSRRRADGRVTILTNSASSSFLAKITSDNWVMFRRGGIALAVPAAGGSEVPVLPEARIATVGDSMTDSGSGFSDTLQSITPELPVIICAEGGEQTPSIAISFGVEGLCVLVVAGNAIPTSGHFTGVPSVGFLNDGACCMVNLTGQDGIKYSCKAWRSGSTYNFQPMAYPASAVALAAGGAALQCTSIDGGGTDPTNNIALSLLHRAKVIIRTGTNDIGPGKPWNVTAYMGHINAMVALVKPLARELLLGDVCERVGLVPTAQGGMATFSQAEAATYLDQVAELRAALQAAYPDNFHSFYQALVDAGYGQAVTVNGTAYTVINAAGLPDGTHESTAAKLATATAVRTRMISKGWI